VGPKQGAWAHVCNHHKVQLGGRHREREWTTKRESSLWTAFGPPVATFTRLEKQLMGHRHSCRRFLWAPAVLA
jgi:hypothetical protein